MHLTGDAKLGKNARAVMQNPNSNLILPIIALAEAIDVVQKKRTKIPDVATLLSDAANEARIEIVPLTFEILEESLSAAAVPEMHDRLITATALHLEKQGFKIAVLTKDPEIVAAVFGDDCLVKPAGTLGIKTNKGVRKNEKIYKTERRGVARAAQSDAVRRDAE